MPDTKLSLPVQTERDDEKREYHAPQVVEYGDLRELTRTNPFAAGQDQFTEATQVG